MPRHSWNTCYHHSCNQLPSQSQSATQCQRSCSPLEKKKPNSFHNKSLPTFVPLPFWRWPNARPPLLPQIGFLSASSPPSHFPLPRPSALPPKGGAIAGMTWRNRWPAPQGWQRGASTLCHTPGREMNICDIRSPHGAKEDLLQEWNRRHRTAPLWRPSRL